MVKKWLYSLFLATALLPIFAFGSDCGPTETATDCAAGSTKSGALFRYAGKEYYENDLDIRIRERLHQLASDYYEERRLLMDNAVWQLYLTQEAERQKKAPEQVAMELINLVEPTDEAILNFYQANKEQIAAPLDEVKQRVTQYLIQQQAIEGRAKLISSIKQEGQYQFLIDNPRPPINTIETDGYPSKGSLLAPVEIVEFADYQCPHCKTSSKIMQHLVQRYGDKLRVVFMDFPINRSGISLKVAEGAVCADQQGKFWDYHDGAFNIQTSLSAKSPLELASSLGLDNERFSNCLVAPETAAKVAKSKSEALRLGLDSTPSFFINGVKLNIQSDVEQALTDAIDRALREAGS